MVYFASLKGQYEIVVHHYIQVLWFHTCLICLLETFISRSMLLYWNILSDLAVSLLLFFLFCSFLIQQGEAKRALEVLQKPSVSVDLQVRFSHRDLGYDNILVSILSGSAWVFMLLFCLGRTFSISLDKYNIQLSMLIVPCSINLRQTLLPSMHMKLWSHGWLQRIWTQGNWFLQWCVILVNLMQSTAYSEFHFHSFKCLIQKWRVHEFFFIISTVLKCRNETHEVIKYLEFCVHKLHNEDPGVHNLLLSLYAKQVEWFSFTFVWYFTAVHKIYMLLPSLYKTPLIHSHYLRC